MKNSSNIAIRVMGVHKTFKLPHESHNGLKQYIINLLSRDKKRGYELQHVLKGVSFEIKKGEFFGIVGRNGSGKSTLLKILADIYKPDSGSVVVNGSLTPFIELGVGFNDELTGKENVFLNGAMLGFSRKKMNEMYRDIVEFAELDRFMDQKLKNYSSGMKVRLAFSIAIRARSDILLLDEVLAVGDSAFQQKCYDYFATLKKEKRTIILVSHGMAAVERFCDRALLLESGEIAKIGKSSEVAGLYEDLFLDDSNKSKKNEAIGSGGVVETKNISIKTEVLQDGKIVNGVKALTKFKLEFIIISKLKYSHLNLGINIRNTQGQVVFSTDTHRESGYITIEPDKGVVVEVEMENRFTNGKYIVDVNVVNEISVSDKVILRGREVREFKIFGIKKHIHSLFHPEVTVKWSEQNTPPPAQKLR